MYLSGLAGESGAPVAVVAALASAPWIGAAGQIAGVWLYSRASSLRGHTLRLATIARATWVLPVLGAAALGARAWSGDTPFPRDGWFALLAASACFAAMVASSSAMAWTTWVRELVPENFHGRFFGLRQRYTMTALVAANLFAAAVVGWAPGGWRLGYGLLGGLALLCAALSTWLLSRVPDVPMPPPLARASGVAAGAAARTGVAGSAPLVAARSDRREQLALDRVRDAAAPALLHVLRRTTRAVRRRSPGAFGEFLSLLVVPLRDPQFRPVLLFTAAFNGAIQFAGPYFPYYFTRELGASMSQVAFWATLTHSGCFLAATAWGRHLDRTGDPRRVLWICGHLIAASPLFYVFGGAGALPWVAPIDFFTNGLVWSGYMLAQTSLLMRSAPRGNAAVYFSVNSAAAGVCGALGVLVGGRVVAWLASWGGFPALFGLASVLRLGVLWTLLRPQLLLPRPPERQSTATPDCGESVASRRSTKGLAQRQS